MSRSLGLLNIKYLRLVIYSDSMPNEAWVLHSAVVALKSSRNDNGTYHCVAIYDRAELQETKI